MYIGEKKNIFLVIFVLHKEEREKREGVEREIAVENREKGEGEKLRAFHAIQHRRRRFNQIHSKNEKHFFFD